MVLPRGFRAKANKISLAVRKRLDLEVTAPVDPWRICSHLEILVVALSEQRDVDGNVPGGHFLAAGSKKFSALTMPVGGQRVIVHNDSHSNARQRSNLAHEIAHCLLGHELAPPLLANGDRDRHSGIEEEAAFLGGALLIPNEAALHIVRMGMSPGTATDRYGVSPGMLTYRLRVSGASVIAARSAARVAGRSGPT